MFYFIFLHFVYGIDVFDTVEYLSSLGKAQTANVKRDAAVGVAQANRDAGIRVNIFELLMSSPPTIQVNQLLFFSYLFLFSFCSEMFSCQSLELLH